MNINNYIPIVMSIERKRNEKTDRVYFIASLLTLEKQPVGHCTNLLAKQGQNIAYSIWVYFTCAQHKYNHIQVVYEVSIKANNHYYILWGNSLLIQCDIVERYKAKYLEYWHKYFMWYGYLYCPCIISSDSSDIFRKAHFSFIWKLWPHNIDLFKWILEFPMKL